MDMSHFVYPSSADGLLNCFYILAIMNYSAMNFCIVSVWTFLLCILVYLDLDGIVGSYGDSV